MKQLKFFSILLLIIFFSTGCYSYDKKHIPPDDTMQTITGTAEPQQEDNDDKTLKSSEPHLSDNSYFEVHYIDVGQADAALVICDGKCMLIDGGNPADSRLIYTYLKKMNVDTLHTIICSHAHDDHVGGLPAAVHNFEFENVYAPERENDIDAYNSFKNAVNSKGIVIQHPKPGDNFIFGSSKVEFYGPVYNTTDLNNTSIVMKVIYGETSFLFTGDAEREEEQDILSLNFDLSATVLKVGHHGSSSSTSYPFLREIMPKYAVISVGSNSYGHPTEETLSKLRDAGAIIYRTDLQGDIIAKSDGNNVTFITQKNSSAVTANNPSDNNSEEMTTGYIGNAKSKKFHYPSCHSLPAEHNRVIFNSREEAIKSGYSPCGNCRP